MMIPCARTIFFLLLLLANAGRAAAQCPPNIGFEAGDFSNWKAYTGTVDVATGIRLSEVTPTNNRHTLMRGINPGLDPYGHFPRRCPNGGGVSVQLGNRLRGAQAEGLSYTFQVPANQDTFTLTYFYAVVFQNPDHMAAEQPRFQVWATDVSVAQRMTCASFDFVASGSIPGFHQSSVDSMVFYKDWTPASLQFLGRAGHTIRLDFRTADCTRGGHFGYAYVDVANSCSNVAAAAPICGNDSVLVLNAPFGFESYTWFDSSFGRTVGTGQTVSVSPVPAGVRYYWVDVVPYPGYGCRDTMKALVTREPVPDTPRGPRDLYFCVNQPPTSLRAQSDDGAVLIWYVSPTATVGSPVPPAPNTTVLGADTFWVSQKVLFGCESARRMIVVHVVPPPQIDLQWDDSCARRTITFRAAEVNGGPISSWEWLNDDREREEGPPERRFNFARGGSYAVTLVATSPNGCEVTRSELVQIYDILPMRPVDTLAAIGQEVRLNGSGGGGPGTRYQWSPATGLLSDTAALAVALAPDDQSYTLYARTPEGCEARSQARIRRMAGPELYVPNAFTPNRDRRNDLLRVIPVGISAFHYFSIYDRNGVLVFQTTDPNVGWDGRFKGREFGTATFVYVAEATDYLGRLLFRKGTVALIR
ncbi:T9SS type B sorting domain-containing protein [Flaviaesturariibacter flavus]|uniref:T9SS type B sorting domain-containing protein n=1 Tax=Flaviaesturariibacter flavus TaxID=2502780 RepID=A0A4R1BBS1_9BACT|nr:T9SS type B sorting domain-containing protein [Flaviaesturariibacter flavus]TCJ14388.1 T9SS type B sorting domain-containing protein [Flaviaesturariibacter flavus]